MADLATNDQELLRQLNKGNEAAFSALYQGYQGPLYRFALHMSGNTATAEEVTQEVFMQLIGNSRTYDPSKGSVAGYLFGIARNLTRRSMMQARRDVPIEDESGEWDGGMLTSGPNMLEDLSQSELTEWLQKAVLALPEPYREVVVLCDLEEMSYPAAGEILGCSQGTVASRLHRARTMLRGKLRTKLETKSNCQGCPAGGK